MNDQNDTPTVAKPLTEPEARKLLTAAVNRKIAQYARRFFKFFGIANIAALITLLLAIGAMWFTIQNAAISTATSTATTVANQTSSVITPVVKDVFEKFLTETTESEGARARLENSINAFQKELNDLSLVLDTTEAKSEGTRKQIEADQQREKQLSDALTGLEKGKVRDVVEVLNNLNPKGEDILAKLAALSTNIRLLADEQKSISNTLQNLNKPLQWTEFAFEIASDDQPNLPNRLLFSSFGNTYDPYNVPDFPNKTFGSFVSSVAIELFDVPMKQSGQDGYWGYLQVRPNPVIANHIQIYGAILPKTKAFNVRVAVTYRE